MRRKVLFTALVAVGCLALFAQLAAFDRGAVSRPEAAALPARPSVIAAPGRVEPASEEIDLAPEMGGKLTAVFVEEGQSVRRGQVVATLESADFRARVAAAEAVLAQREAELRRVVNGARDQERLAATAAEREASAVAQQAHSEWQRRRALYAQGVIAREEAERAEREYLVAKERHEAERQRRDLVRDDAREEDRSAAEAAVALARAQLAEARATLAKTEVRSPIDGVVLRKHLNAGESVSDQMPGPVVTLGDTAVMRVRAEVDETDVARLRVGQRAYATADAFGDRRFAGTVVRVGQVLGRKNVRTDRPTERVDTKVLEAMVELEDGSELPAGLRVDVFLDSE